MARGNSIAIAIAIEISMSMPMPIELYSNCTSIGKLISILLVNSWRLFNLIPIRNPIHLGKFILLATATWHPCGFHFDRADEGSTHSFQINLNLISDQLV